MKQETLDKILNEVHDETLRLKTAQPYYNGQLSMKKIYSNTITPVANYVGIRVMVTYTANTQNNPFCEHYLMANIGGNYNIHGLVSAFPVGDAYSASSIIASDGRTVTKRFYVSPNLPSNTPISLSAECIASDYGTVVVSLW